MAQGRGLDKKSIVWDSLAIGTSNVSSSELHCQLSRTGCKPNLIHRIVIMHMAKKLYVGNLSYSTNDEGLREHFSQAGAVSSAVVISDRETGRSKGFGFVEYEADADADKAIEMFDGQDLDGRNLKVNEARPREDRPRY